MADLYLNSNVFNDVTITIQNLENDAGTYDKFVWRIYQNNIKITEIAHPDPSAVAGYRSIRLSFKNTGHLGFNYFSPSCTYKVYLDCYYDATAYTLSPITFTTTSISPPSNYSSVSPYAYTIVKDQGDTGTCVAQSLSTAMSIFKAKEAGITYENYSVSYIYGSDGQQDLYGMYYDEAVYMCKTYGSPRWELVSGLYPDNNYKSDSVDLFNNADAFVRSNAIKQKFTGYENIDFYDTNSVAEAIYNYGYFMFNFRIPDNFYDVGSSGIVPQPDNYSGDDGFESCHSIALIGLTVINGKKYWIGQNSWGTSWGDNGICYIPYDWGAGVQAPYIKNNTAPTSWTQDSYSVWNSNISADNPSRPYNINAVCNDSALTIDLTWDCGETGDIKYFVYARGAGTDEWYLKLTASSKFGTIQMDAAKTYEIMIIAVKNSLCSQQSECLTVSIQGRPPYWYWTEDNYGASYDIIWQSYQAIIDNGYTADFSYKVWNAMVEYTVQCCLYKNIFDTPIGEAVYGFEATATYRDLLSSIKMYNTDTTLTAQNFNILRYCVGSLVSTGMFDVFSGDIVYGNYFDNIISRLNDVS